MSFLACAVLCECVCLLFGGNKIVVFIESSLCLQDFVDREFVNRVSLCDG